MADFPIWFGHSRYNGNCAIYFRLYAFLVAKAGGRFCWIPGMLCRYSFSDCPLCFCSWGVLRQIFANNPNVKHVSNETVQTALASIHSGIWANGRCLLERSSTSPFISESFPVNLCFLENPTLPWQQNQRSCRPVALPPYRRRGGLELTESGCRAMTQGICCLVPNYATRREC